MKVIEDAKVCIAQEKLVGGGSLVLGEMVLGMPEDFQRNRIDSHPFRIRCELELLSILHSNVMLGEVKLVSFVCEVVGGDSV